MSLTDNQAPFIEPYAIAGNPKKFRSKGNTAIAVKRAMAHLGFLEWNPPYDSHYNVILNDAVASWKRKRGIIQADSNDGSWGRKTHEIMQTVWYEDAQGYKQPAFDSFSQDLLQKEKSGQQADSKLPELGPFWKGGLSVLDQNLTHMTTGLPKYPAWDDAFEAYREVIAPENIEVFKKDTSASPGEAIYALGESDLVWWIAHLDRDHPLGKVIPKGNLIGKVFKTSVGGGSHVHVAINIENIAGQGEQLLYGRTGFGPNYTHSPITIGEQLVKLF